MTPIAVSIPAIRRRMKELPRVRAASEMDQILQRIQAMMIDHHGLFIKDSRGRQTASKFSDFLGERAMRFLYLILLILLVMQTPLYKKYSTKYYEKINAYGKSLFEIEQKPPDKDRRPNYIPSHPNPSPSKPSPNPERSFSKY